MEGTLKDVRKEAGLSQEQLAVKTTISQVVVSNIESGKNSPRAETREKIEKELGPIDWLNTRKLPNRLEKKVDLIDAENHFVKAIVMIRSLKDEQKFRFFESAEYFLQRLINTEILSKKLHDIQSGTPVEDVFTDEEIKYWSEAASNELLKRKMEGVKMI